ncbi:MAG: hypothetical protein ACPG7F_04375, partial [Aggregatilineales bacterium]
QSGHSYTLRPEDGKQTFTGNLNQGERIDLTVVGGGRGMRLYVYAGSDIGADTVVYILNAEGSILRQDDDSGGNLNAMTFYTLEDTTTHYVQIYIENVPAAYRIVVGLDTPEVLDEGTFVNSVGGEGQTLSCDRVDTSFLLRPILSGATNRAESPNFVLHFTTEGIDATTREYVVAMRDALEASLAFQLSVGWDMPPSDCGEGGDDRIDVYIMELESQGLLGYAQPDAFVIDNPNSVIIENRAAFAHLAMENDMSEFDNPIAVMQSTAAHEFHHLVQMGYDVRDSYAGMYEAGAVWVETQVFPEITDATRFVGDVMENPDMCIGITPRVSQMFRIYGEWVMVESMTRDLGANIYNLIWQELVTDSGLAGFYKALWRLGTSPAEVVARMNVRHILRDYPSPIIEDFPRHVFVETTATGTGDFSPSRNGVQQLAADIVRFEGQGVYMFDVNRSVLDIYVLGVDSSTATAQLYHPGKEGIVDTRGFTDAYVVIVNTEEHPHGEACDYLSWRLTVNEVGETMLALAVEGELWAAPNFIPIFPEN